MKSTIWNEDHDSFRAMVRDFLAKEVVPVYPEWDEHKLVPKSIFRRLGDLGVVGMSIPEEYGGAGEESYLYYAAFLEECQKAYINLGGLSVHMGVNLPYFLEYCTDEQRQRWFPGFAAGELMTSIAMTEPGTGSDLAGMSTTAVRDGDDWIVNGTKTFITGGIQSDLVITVARTSKHEDDRRKGLTLFVVEADMAGFSRGRNLDKIGLRTQDTAELFFQDVRVPDANVLGEVDEGFTYLTSNLPQERLGIAVGAQAAAEGALVTTLDYVRERKVFGKPVASFQNTKFELAACATEIEAGRALLDKALVAHDAKELTVADAAKVKIFCTELQARVIDRCLQLHGGYGYMREYPIARLYADARVMRIYGGTTEVLKSVVSKDLGL